MTSFLSILAHTASFINEKKQQEEELPKTKKYTIKFCFFSAAVDAKKSCENVSVPELTAVLQISAGWCLTAPELLLRHEQHRMNVFH